MSRRGSRNDDEAWANAKKLCTLNNRQVEMARALGMNPKKLPRLRPSPTQRWKLPVGPFIEECYRKRFGGLPPLEQPGPSRNENGPRPDTAPVARPADWQIQNLVCYFANLGDELEQWLAHGKIPPELPAEVADELRKIANALATGDTVPEIPELPTPPPPRGRRVSAFEDDDDTPF